MDRKPPDKTAESIELVLGKPFAATMADTTEKIRRNLLVVSSVTVVSVILGIRIAPANSLLGVSFEGLTPDVFKTCLLAVNVYMLAHFCWCVTDELQEWRLRVTGTRTAFITAGVWSSEDGDHPSEPRQSTLYNWWKQRAPESGRTKAALERIENAIRARLDQLEPPPSGELTKAERDETFQLAEVKSDLESVRMEIQRQNTVLESKRIEVSLRRFDGAYQLFLRSQNLRWLIMEAGFPVLFGAMSIAILVRDVYFMP
jgi:hypothetical protein